MEPSCCADGAASRTTTSRYRDGQGCRIVRMVLFGVFGVKKHSRFTFIVKAEDEEIGDMKVGVSSDEEFFHPA